MGARSSRLQEESLCGALGKDGGVKRESLRRIRGSRPSSLALQFSTGFERDSEPIRSRSDSDTGRRGAPAETGTERGVEPESGNGEDGPVSPERLSRDPAGSGALRDRGSSGGLTAARRLPSGRSSARAARARTAGPLPEAWIGLYRVRHCMRCPVCNRPFPEGRIEEHLLTCLTSPSLPYNTDVLSKDSGECSICLEELLQGDTIARLACLCVYHKKCIDSWSSVKPCCPEHPFD